MLELDIAITQWIVTNGKRHIIGVDLASGGYPCVATNLAEVKYFPAAFLAQEYVNIINGTNNGETLGGPFRVRRVRLSLKRY